MTLRGRTGDQFIFGTAEAVAAPTEVRVALQWTAQLPHLVWR